MKSLNFIFVALLTILVSGCNQIGKLSIGNITSTSQAPISFTITSAVPGNSQIDLDWPTVINAESYTVKYRLTTDSVFTIASTSATRPFNLNGLTNGLSYVLVVEAHNSFGITETPPIIVSPTTAPVTVNLNQTFNEDTQGIITLTYNDGDGDLAVTCAITNLSHITETQVCACAAGVCTVGVTGTLNYNGPASFDFTVTAGGDVSNSSTASLTISPVDDAPVSSPITPAAFNEDAQSIISLPYTDLEGHQASSCALTGLTNVTITQPCTCILGACTVGVTGTLNYSGVAAFNYTVTANGLISNSSAASLTITAVNDAPVAANISPAAFNEDTQSIITLSYTDAEMDQATTCAISSPVNVSVTQACACAAGVCTVGVTGTLNYNGAASFNYTVTAGVVSNSATATLSILPVDDAPVAANITPAAVATNVQSIITLSYTDLELNLATTCAISAPTNVSVTQACACATGVCTVGVTGTAQGSGSFNYTVTANGLVSNSATATFSVNLTCPAGYVEVPGNSTLGTLSFCVMQFEARDVSGAPQSVSSGTPWVSISSSNAQTACTTLGTGYDLISNPEWMTVARNIEQQTQNWTSGIVGTGRMFQGRASMPYLTITDVNNPYDQTGYTSASPLGGGLEQRRTLHLSSGGIVWDFSGNQDELVDFSMVSGFQNPPSCGFSYSSQFPLDNCDNLVAEDMMPLTAAINQTQHLGSFNHHINPFPLKRGNAATVGAAAGIFGFISGQNSPSASTSFRCVWRPPHSDVAPRAIDVDSKISSLSVKTFIRLPHTDPNGDSSDSCSLSNITNLTVVDACSCSNGECSVSVNSGTPGAASFNFTVTSNGLTSNTATATIQVFECPTDYILVPGNATRGIKDFCVMKYEGKTINGISGTAPTGLPTNEPGAGCGSVGKNYSKLTNPEWMAIAENIENVNSNWTGGSVGSGVLYIGHTDGAPGTILEVTDVNDPYNGTGETVGSDQRRTLALSNGNVIWDFSGNAKEKVDWSLGSVTTQPVFCAPGGTIEINQMSCPGLVPLDVMPSNPAFDSTKNIGKFGGLNSSGVVFRGGHYLGGASAGIYAFSFEYAFTNETYRCVYRPETIDSPPVAHPISAYLALGTPETIQLAYTDGDAHRATSCAVTNLTNATIGTCTCLTTGICTVDITGTTLGAASFDYTVTANGLTSNTVSVATTVHSCPNGFINVPGNASLGVADFCVMKYEAKGYGSKYYSLPYYTNPSPSSASMAKNACTNLGTNFDLISNFEWMTIARNIEVQTSNWSSGVVGTGCIWQGNVGSNTACAYVGSTSGEYGINRNPKAKHTLSNSEEIWDFSGNFLEWVDWSMASGYQTFPSSCALTQVNTATCDNIPVDAYKSVDTSLTNSHGIGRLRTGSGQYPLRGGAYNSNSSAGGIYMLWNENDTLFANSGFRCVYRPPSAATAPLVYALNPINVNEDVAKTITLTYSDPNGDAATSCSLSNLSNITITTACTCTSGVCTVGIRGTTDYYGPASFDYTVTANGQTSAPASASFTIAAVADVPVATATTFDPLDLNVQNILILPYTDGDGDLATACNITTTTNVIVSQACACDVGGVCTVGVTSSSAGASTFAFTVTANAQTSTAATATLGTCAANWISVPKNTSLSVPGFCAMKFEAKNVGGIATSNDVGAVWNSITRTASRTACTALGAKYDLISNPQWMTIARNLEGVASNWTSGSVGTGMMYRGHSDNVPASVLTVTNVNDGYDGTGESAGSEQRRTLTLSNGNVIWDFAGNVSEFADWTAAAGLQAGPTLCSDNNVEINLVSCGFIAVDDYMPTNTSLTSANSIGKFFGGANGGANRGGSFNDTTGAGIYHLNLVLNDSTANINTGFRCVWRP